MGRGDEGEGLNLSATLSILCIAGLVNTGK